MSATGRDDTATQALPVRVIEHDGVVTCDPRELSESERALVGWMEEHEPADVDESVPADAD